MLGRLFFAQLLDSGYFLFEMPCLSFAADHNRGLNKLKQVIYRERRMAIHWEHEAIFRENHPGIDVMTTGVIVDGRFFTSSGGLSVAELVLATISYFHGPVLAGQVGDVLYFSGNDTRRNTRNAPVSDPVRRAELLMIRNMQKK